MQASVFGFVDDAHAAAADLFLDAVVGDGSPWLGDLAAGTSAAVIEFAKVRPAASIAGFSRKLPAFLRAPIKDVLPLATVDRHRRPDAEKRCAALPATRALPPADHRSVSSVQDSWAGAAVNSRYSHALAVFQSLMMVIGETFSTTAVSSTLSPSASAKFFH